MKKLRKIGFIGLLFTSLIASAFYFGVGMSMSLLCPFFMPWLVLILISFTSKSQHNE